MEKSGSLRACKSSRSTEIAASERRCSCAKDGQKILAYLFVAISVGMSWEIPTTPMISPLLISVRGLAS